jgi:serine/threonine-protein kinase
VFRAYDATRERLVAVKLFKLDLPPERAHQLVAEFERLIAADLTHPALAAPLATGISGVSAFLAQDYVAADSLDLTVREYGAAPLANALRVAAQLAGALDFAAAAQVTHGALHPRDVLLSSDDTRLTGLGITRALERIGVVAPVRRPYTAPERIAGSDWDRRADVFSLVALMHELIWGRRVSGHGAQAAEGLTEIAGGDLPSMQAVFARALAGNPDARYGTALEFADALRIACPNVAPETAPAPKRRAARDHEPRLPLDELPAESAEAVHAAPPAADSADLQRGSPNRDARDGGTLAAFDMPVDLDIALEKVPEPEIRYEPFELPHDPAPDQAATPRPAGLITGHDSDALSALERTRSAVWPLVLALIVGIAIGFAGGFFAGSREQTPGAAAPIAAAPPAPAAKEFTEAAVPAAPTPAPAAVPAETAKNSELRTQNSEPRKNLKSEINNLKSPAVSAGRLLVRSRPAGARVSVDGKDYGPTPATVRDLARGAHRVRIVHDGYGAEERRIVITPSRPAQTMSVALTRGRGAATSRTAPTAGTSASRLAGALVVDSRPAGAQVFVDGKLAGTTPMTLPSVSAGSHAIRLDHAGYRRWSSSIRVVAGEQNRVTASLER